MTKQAGKGDKWRKTDYAKYWESEYWDKLKKKQELKKSTKTMIEIMVNEDDNSSFKGEL
jgi:hypothetical protein